MDITKRMLLRRGGYIRRRCHRTIWIHPVTGGQRSRTWKGTGEGDWFCKITPAIRSIGVFLILSFDFGRMTYYESASSDRLRSFFPGWSWVALFCHQPKFHRSCGFFIDQRAEYMKNNDCWWSQSDRHAAESDGQKRLRDSSPDLLLVGSQASS
ncbi:Meiotic chromosome segregation protein [Fusarium oxysporum f. sp. albedinis]|nr:Meiotic chromosome segregation protein [Fusarium oxysporum f. sp. albedinis]